MAEICGMPTPATTEDLTPLIRGITYENTSDDLTEGARTLTFTANDGDTDSNVATATITCVASNDAPVMTLDADNSGGGADDSGFETTYNEDAAAVTQAVKGHTTLPVVVKLTPNVTDIAEIARAVEQAGADAVSLVNTLRGMAIDVESRKPFLGGISGGLSGPAIKPVALYMVYQVAQAVKVPVIGGGGIISAGDALEFIMAGASAFWVSTGVLVDPDAPLAVLDGVVEFMEREGIEDIAELIGVASST